MDTMRHREYVRRYISDHHVSLELGNRIYGFTRHRGSTKQRLHECDVPIFALMPETLKVCLHWEVYFPMPTKHPWFQACYETDQVDLLSVCHRGMTEMSVPNC